jgi:hypothetical protein
MNRHTRPASLVIRSASAVGTAAFLAVAAMALFGVETASGQTTDPTCSLSGTGVLSIDLFGGTVTIAEDGMHFVVSPSSSCAGPYPVASVMAITFAVDSTASVASTVVLDTTSHEFPTSPCVPIGGTVGNTTAGEGTVQVLSANGENITVGSTGVNLAPGSCDGSVGTLSGVGSYQIDDTTAASLTAVTLSAAGGAGTGAATTVPIAVVGGTTTHHLDNSTFIAGAGTDTLSAAGTGDQFVAGSGSATISDATASNTVDFSALTTAVTVNVSGSQVASTADGTATAGSATDTFTGLTEPSTFIGATPASGGTTFDAGSNADTFDGQGLAGDTLSYAFASGSALQINAGTGVAHLGSVTESFAGIHVFDGLAAGNTTFVSGATGGDTVNATGTGNTADFSAATSAVPGVSVDLSTSPATVSGFASGGPDSMTGINSVTGSATGQNTFVAGAGNETYAQTGSGVGDAIDFSAVATSQSTPLIVNVSGGPANSQANDSASVGATTYAFSTGGSAFTGFTGASTGNTDFLASGTGGYSFAATGSNDRVDFSTAASAVNVNLSPSTEGGVSPGEAAVPSGVDTISGLTSVVGSSAGGNTFAGGAAGPYTFSSGGSGNRFVAGAGNATFIDATSGNTVDFSALTTPVVVNVSGVQVGSTANGTARAGSATDTFTGLGSPTTFIGAAGGGTTFYAGSAPDTFIGQGLAGDTLSYAFASDGSLRVNASTGSALLGSVTEPFSGIRVFDGLGAGNTAFASGATGGDTFNATGSGNAADFSAATSGVTIDLSTTPATVTGFARGGPDTMTGINAVTGSSAGLNTFRAGSGNASFSQTGPGGGDTIDFSKVATSPTTPLTVNVSGGSVGGGPANDSASVGTTTYTFSAGGAAFTRFTGATTGNTDFLASGSGGYAFKALGSPNRLDLSAAPAGTRVRVNRNSIQTPGVVLRLAAGSGGKKFDTFSDIQYFAGHVAFTSQVHVQQTTLRHATVGVLYSVQLIGAGGAAPYRDWSDENGLLPPGLTLSASGVVSGTPTATGTYSFVVTLVDGHNIVGATRITLVVK